MLHFQQRTTRTQAMLQDGVLGGYTERNMERQVSVMSCYIQIVVQ
jgi:hypothetical protein